MNLRNVIHQARAGRPDLAAKNLAVSRGDGMLAHPARFLRILKKYPHSSGRFFSVAYLASCYRDAKEEALNS